MFPLSNKNRDWLLLWFLATNTNKNMRNTINSQNAPQPIGPYVQAVQTSGTFIFLSGSIPLLPTGEVVEGGIKEQTAQVLKNIDAILKEANATAKNVVKTTVYLKDMNHFGEFNSVYAEYFTENPPARTTIQVSRLPKDVLIEIEAIAVI